MKPSHRLLPRRPALLAAASRRLAALGLAAACTAAGAAAGGAAGAAAPAAPKADLAKGGQIATQLCAACHSVDGSRGSPAQPILQGQHPAYLVRQLDDYKHGRRDNPIMKGIASTLTPDDMRDVSAFYASKEVKPGFAKSRESVALGERIWRAGIAERDVPACAACHSPNGAGIPSQYPRLAGQHGDYTAAQLVAFRSGARANSQVMIDVAAKMNDREIKAVADYVTGLR